MHSVNSPDFFAAFLIYRRDERPRPAIFLIALQDYQSFVKHGRHAVPHSHFGNLAQRLFPDRLSIKVVTVQSFGFKESINKPPVCYRRARSISVFSVTIIIDSALIGGLLPEYLSRVAIKAEH